MILDWTKIRVFVKPGFTDMRKQINGLSLIDQIPTVIGLVVWLAISLGIAIRFFVWKEVAA